MAGLQGRVKADHVIHFLEKLVIPEGIRAGKRIKLAPYQKSFVRGAMADGISIAILSVARGGGKSALSAGIALAALIGVYDAQPRREIIVGARTAQQAQIAFEYLVGFCRSLPPAIQSDIHVRKSPRLELRFEGDGGGHIVRAISSDGRSSLGSSPVLVLMDEFAAWRTGAGSELEHALLSGLGKRNGRALIISTSADSDSHPFSTYLDNPQEGTYIQEHRAEPGLPADDLESLKAANPGAEYGIGASLEWLQAAARRSIARGGSNLSSFRNYCRNERVSSESRDVVLSVDQWLACECNDLPERSGSVVIGLDLGSSASMSAASYWWPDTGRLESLATFPSVPSLADRGAADGVGTRYEEMKERGELSTCGENTVPVAPWLRTVIEQVDGETVQVIVADRYKQAEMSEAFMTAGIRAEVCWRGMGFRDGSEDLGRFQRAAFDGLVKSAPSLLMRSAFADAVVIKDVAGNAKLAKGRSNGKIDAVASSILAVAEGVRRNSRPVIKRRAPTWV